MKSFHLFGLLVFAYVLRESESYLKLSKPGAKKCIKPLGCFELTRDFFKIIKRPINTLPQDRRVINTRFLLYTATNSRETYELKAENKKNLVSSPLNVTTPTRFIVHGFLDNIWFGPWQGLLKDELLLGNKGNVIIVDWSGGNGLPYVQAAANSRVVGAEIAYLIKSLEKTVGFNRSNAHIIGHSLGAHIAGYAGERLPGLGRITGLDPAEPFFQDLPPKVRLDETDARFVDVIHTDSKSIAVFGLGMKQLIGHVDFFPNDGYRQPGCALTRFTSIFTKGFIEGVRQIVSCNHQRAVEIFHASINSKSCLPVGYQCSSWKQFLEGKCIHCGPDGSKCGIMGFRADERKPNNQTNVKLYLKTNGKNPYCLNHYQVSFKLLSGTGVKPLIGKVEIKLHGKFADVSAKYKGPKELYSGSRYFYMITTDKNIGEIEDVGFVWKDTSKRFLFLFKFAKKELFLEHITVTPMNIIDHEEKLSKTKKFCRKNPLKPIYSEKLAVLHSSYC